MLFSKKDPEKEARKEYAHYMATISGALDYSLGTSFLDKLICDKRELSDSLHHIFGTYYLEDVFTEFVSDDVWEKFVERVNAQKHNYAKRHNQIFIKKEIREKIR